MSASCRFFASCIVLSLLIAAKETHADLEVGTAFGANWVQVEDYLRSDFLSSFTEVRKFCAAEANCPSEEIRRVCGYGDDEQLDGTPSPLRFYQRHKFDEACPYIPDAEHGCYLEVCLKQCFEEHLPGTEIVATTTSGRCQQSIFESREKFRTLQQVEISNDEAEQKVIRLIIEISIISIVSSILVIFIFKSWPSGRNLGTVEKCFIFLNAACVGFLLASSALVKSTCLFVHIVPFAIVQVVYFAFFHVRTPSLPPASTAENTYSLMEDIGSSDKSNAYVGVPIQII